MQGKLRRISGKEMQLVIAMKPAFSADNAAGLEETSTIRNGGD
jgi:hypothetical protein